MTIPDPPNWVNVGTGEEISIRALAEIVRDAFGLNCSLRFDSSMPDGTPRKLLDCGLIRSMGWKAQIGLREGVARTVADFRHELTQGRLRGETRTG